MKDDAKVKRAEEAMAELERRIQRKRRQKKEGGEKKKRKTEEDPERSEA